MPVKKKKKPFRKVIMANNKIEKVLSNKMLQKIGLNLLQKMANNEDANDISISVYSEDTLNTSAFSSINRLYDELNQSRVDASMVKEEGQQNKDLLNHTQSELDGDNSYIEEVKEPQTTKASFHKMMKLQQIEDQDPRTPRVDLIGSHGELIVT